MCVDIWTVFLVFNGTDALEPKWLDIDFQRVKVADYNVEAEIISAAVGQMRIRKIF